MFPDAIAKLRLNSKVASLPARTPIRSSRSTGRGSFLINWANEFEPWFGRSGVETGSGEEFHDLVEENTEDSSEGDNDSPLTLCPARAARTPERDPVSARV